MLQHVAVDDEVEGARRPIVQLAQVDAPAIRREGAIPHRIEIRRDVVARCGAAAQRVEEAALGGQMEEARRGADLDALKLHPEKPRALQRPAAHTTCLKVALDRRERGAAA